MIEKKRLFNAEEKKFYIELGRFLIAQRQKLGLSQKDIAKLTGITFQQVQKYETAQNRIQVFTLHKIAQAYGVSFTKILDTYAMDCDYRVLDTARVQTLLNNAIDALNELSQFLTASSAPNN